MSSLTVDFGGAAVGGVVVEGASAGGVVGPTVGAGFGFAAPAVVEAEGAAEVDGGAGGLFASGSGSSATCFVFFG